ncbi:carotenoid 1,2-hydratase [Leptospira langatensis]|uniref:Carotenoid 1,2-hydratase n=1 Tax=Leptospira langatensis TaxID=2484983 RepID=A0A5F1ZTX1_9LEPT|nr:lipocalin-like domain-containing protein [Leptospira langatensis]TGK01551.1 carotenoid 1,2-hydratase [Leptospira langatensis]TGL41999.1 carotenoid 1,2-hydratase [Leptospira langatensis]
MRLSNIDQKTKSRRKFLSSVLPILFLSILFFAADQDRFAADPAKVEHKDKAFKGFKFPQDHLFHKGYKVEWCYFIGILDTDQGKQLGYELSFFRAYLGSKVAVYPVHFAISDMSDETHKFTQTLERELGDVAGQNTTSLWSGDYRMEVTGPGSITISAFPRTEAGFGLELELSSKPKDVLVHGKNGKSFKSRTNPKFYSHYYSVPRMETKGSLYLEGKEYNVRSGTSWMDHEWSSPEGSEANFDLSSKDISWDWICIQMEDGSDIMAFNFRSKSSPVAETFGTYRGPDGKVILFEKENELSFQSEDKTWKSKVTNISYKLKWKLISDRFKLNISPKFEEQEFDARSSTGLAYWEGGVNVSGEIDGKTVKGIGYLELKPSR